MSLSAKASSFSMIRNASQKAIEALLDFFKLESSGGLMSKGHPIGATGLAQCFELCNQLRGNAGARQVAGARIGLQHNLGLGGAAVVTLYRQS